MESLCHISGGKDSEQPFKVALYRPCVSVPYFFLLLKVCDPDHMSSAAPGLGWASLVLLDQQDRRSACRSPQETIPAPVFPSLPWAATLARLAASTAATGLGLQGDDGRGPREPLLRSASPKGGMTCLTRKASGCHQSVKQPVNLPGVLAPDQVKGWPLGHPGFFQ